MRGFLVAGNWKMHGSNAANAALVDGILAGMPALGEGEKDAGKVSLLICPPFPYLPAMAAKVAGTALQLGAQTLSEHDSGAYTGEVSASMLRDIGCRFVIVGHSERRAIFGESSVLVAAKFVAAQHAGLVPILCVGESLEQRQANETEATVNEQLLAVIELAGISAFRSAIVAYEPVWAIGTGMTASPEQAQAVHLHIRGVIATRDKNIAAGVQILYGGSVKGSNAAGLFGQPDIDGGLIGGASLKPEDFLAIAQAATSLG